MICITLNKQLGLPLTSIKLFVAIRHQNSGHQTLLTIRSRRLLHHSLIFRELIRKSERIRPIIRFVLIDFTRYIIINVVSFRWKRRRTNSGATLRPQASSSRRDRRRNSTSSSIGDLAPREPRPRTFPQYTSQHDLQKRGGTKHDSNNIYALIRLLTVFD